MSEYEKHIVRSLLTESRVCVIYLKESSETYGIDPVGADSLVKRIDTFLESL